MTTDKSLQQQLKQPNLSQQPVIFVTGNQGKLEDFNQLLSDCQLTDAFTVQDLDLVELQGSHQEIAMEKCRMAAQLLNGPAVLIEDTSLELTALNGLPGPYIKWFWKALRNERLPSLLAAYPDKSAVAKSIVAYCPGPGREIRLFHGECRGRLLTEPRGPPVHGWLPLFAPDGQDQSLAEMEAAERYRHHHRAKAFAKFFAYFAKYRNNTAEYQSG
ncbi:hypothetical protein BOX15_Mlig011450g1 [Macrostomum lignano]|uniref:XTP/dITP diphosphatase n=1 Tax=Macrostomum lignano TaxID=282301 RepID=A0A267GYU4_9PLAT|nr:hypothetical protein BOX15_Mlig011450g1 [Macrostomum lignano]